MTVTPSPPASSPPPEGDVVRRARLARGLSLAEAAARVVELFGGRLSASRLSQIETGNLKRDGEVLYVQAGHARLAHVAYVVGTSPDQLAEAGRPESAEILREVIRQQQEGKDPLAVPAPRDDPEGELRSLLAGHADDEIVQAMGRQLGKTPAQIAGDIRGWLERQAGESGAAG